MPHPLILDTSAQSQKTKFSRTLDRFSSLHEGRSGPIDGLGIAKLFLIELCVQAAWHTGNMYLLPLALVLPLSIGLARSGKEAVASALVYFGAFWSPCIQGTPSFFGDRTIVRGLLFWIIGTVLCSLPFLVLLNAKRRYWGVLTIAAIAVHAISPIGIGSPIIAAGALFPYAMWLGIVALLYLSYWLARNPLRWKYTVVPLFFALLCNVASFFWPVTSVRGWKGIDTDYPAHSADPLDDWKHLQAMMAISEATNATVILFPEGAVSEWSVQTALPFLGAQVDQLRHEGKTVLFGASTDSGIPHIKDNALVELGSDTATEYRQRIPIPYGMWGNGYQAHLFGNGILEIEGLRAGVLICYEQLLVLPALESLAHEPNVLLGTANLNWARHTSIGKTEAVCLRSWARLGAIPLVAAVNR